MEVNLTKPEQRRYNQIHASRTDISFTIYYAGVLLKKGWHFGPWSRRGTTYNQQAAFTTALITSYNRPFNGNKDWAKELLNKSTYDAAETTQHKELIDLRDQVYAHSDTRHYTSTPWHSEVFSTDIESAPFFAIGRDETALVEGMGRKLLSMMAVEAKLVRDSALERASISVARVALGEPPQP